MFGRLSQDADPLEQRLASASIERRRLRPEVLRSLDEELEAVRRGEVVPHACLCQDDDEERRQQLFSDPRSRLVLERLAAEALEEEKAGLRYAQEDRSSCQTHRPPTAALRRRLLISVNIPQPDRSNPCVRVAYSLSYNRLR